MDKNGDGMEINMNDLSKVEELDFKGFDSDMLLLMCILSGCDYVDSIKGIGLKKAHWLVYENGNDLKLILKKIRREGKFLIPQEYEKVYETALLTFKFQYVYCPIQKVIVHLNSLEEHPLRELLESYENIDFLGKFIENNNA